MGAGANMNVVRRGRSGNWVENGERGTGKWESIKQTHHEKHMESAAKLYAFHFGLVHKSASPAATRMNHSNLFDFVERYDM